MRRIASGLAAAIAAVALLAPAASAQEASLTDIEDEVMCPICGTLLELSEAPQAERQRDLIRRLIAQGRSKEEIKEALVAEYGEEVLATPESSGFDLAAWVIPIAGLAAALAALGIWLRRRGGAGAEEAPPPLDAADAERLERDISSRDI
ncbi:MAG: cytochrome c-type biogenesis protein CcmH [Solirubrobacterales bacterium]